MWEIEDGLVDEGDEDEFVDVGYEDGSVGVKERTWTRGCGRWKKDLAIFECSFPVLPHLGSDALKVANGRTRDYVTTIEKHSLLFTQYQQQFTRLIGNSPHCVAKLLLEMLFYG